MDFLFSILVLATFFFAAFLKGTAGLGFATTCLGIMAMYADMRLAIPLVILPSLLANLMVMIDAGDFVRVFRRFWIMYLAAVPGLFFGLWVLGGGETRLPRLVLGVSMILYGGWGLWGGSFSLQLRAGSAALVGVFTGLINGLTGSQIMPVLPYLMSLPISKDELVQAINTSFTFSSLIMLAGLGRMGLVSSDVLMVSAVGVIPVFAGIWLGGRLRRRLPEALFRKAVLVLVTLLGVVLVVRSLG